MLAKLWSAYCFQGVARGAAGDLDCDLRPILLENQHMDDLLPLFDGDDSAQSSLAPLASRLTASQREALKKAFAQLGVADARGQFAIVEELTGQRITSVQELEERHAQTLIYRLANRVTAIGRISTGNAWNDREEDTWIDRL